MNWPTPTPEALADQLDALSRQVASLQSRFASQDQAALEAALSPADVMRFGAYPSGADVYPAGTTTPGSENIIADGAVVDASLAAGIDPVLLRTTATLTNADAIANPNRVAFNSDDHLLYRSDGATWAVKADAAAILSAGTVIAGLLAAASVTTSKLSVADGLGGNLIPNGSWQTTADVGPYSTGSGSYARASEGLSDGYSMQLDATGPSVTYRRSTEPFKVLPGGTISASLWFRNHTAGSPTVQAWVLARKSTTSWPSFDYSYLIVSEVPADGGAFIQRSLVGQVVASDAVEAVVAFGMVTNPAVGAGYVTSVRYEDIQVEYGSAVTAYRPALMNSNVVVDSSSIAVTNGAITVTNAGSTVVIDGSSNMFKIAATGTHSRAFPNALDTDATSNAQLNGLGNGYTVPPACLWNVYSSNDNHRGAGTLVWYLAGSHTIGAMMEAKVYLNAGVPVSELVCSSVNVNFSAYTGYSRYYVLLEAGI